MALVLSVVAGVGVAFVAADATMRTLNPVGLDGAPAANGGGIVATWGIALYVAGVGVALAIVGSVMLRASRQRAD